MKHHLIYSIQLTLVLILCYTAYTRTDFFCTEQITAPLLNKNYIPIDESVVNALSQPYYYLGQGRQTYAFVSQDRQFVIKFFKAPYFKVPWYFKWNQSEIKKRKLRQYYYENSYFLGLPNETQVLYVHTGQTQQSLPILSVTDKASRQFRLNLNTLPFVFQRKGSLFYSALIQAQQAKNEEKFKQFIQQFIKLIAQRMERNIADGDQDVEHNFGVIGDTVFHLDPGRLFREEGLLENRRARLEWEKSTRNFRKWLMKTFPQYTSYLDQQIDEWMEICGS